MERLTCERLARNLIHYFPAAAMFYLQAEARMQLAASACDTWTVDRWALTWVSCKISKVIVFTQIAWFLLQV